MNRYQSSSTRITADGRVIYTSTIPKTVEKTIHGIDIIAKEGDRLDNLANKYYGKASLWWAIASANQIVEQTMHVEPGTILHIPAISEI